MLMKKPVPDIIEQILKMDGFMQEIFKERTKSNKLKVDATIEKIQQNTRGLYDPLASTSQYLMD